MADGQNRWLAVGFFAVASLWAGCTTATTARYWRSAPTGIAPQDGVVVILTRFSDGFSSAKEETFSRCISDALLAVDPTVRIVSGDEFRRLAFPDLTPEQVPPRPWEELVTDDAFRLRVAPMGLRYLVSVSGRTAGDWKFFVKAGFGNGAYGFEIHRYSYLDGMVVDLKEGRKSGEVRASVVGETLWLAPPLPLVIPVMTEAHACSKLGGEVAKLLSVEGPIEQTDTESLRKSSVPADATGEILTIEEFTGQLQP